MLTSHAAAAIATLFTSAAPAALGAHPEAEALVGQGSPGQAARFGNVPASGIMLLSHLNLAELDPAFGSFSANDCWGYVTPTGREIAIIGLRAATAFVDITDPYQPDILATFQSPESLWRDIKVLDDHAYAVSEGGGHIQVFDLSQADQGTIVDRGFTSLGGGSSTHNIAIDEVSGYLYRLGSFASLRAYSVGARGLPGSPTQPVETIIDPGFYVHDAQIVTYDSGPYAGRQIGFLCAANTLRIWDLTDKQSPFELSWLSYPDRRYVHQGWLSEDRTHFYVNDELDRGPTRMHIFNVEDLENPAYVKAWTNGNTSTDHNLYVRGDRVFAANYTSGLRVFDIGDRENPVEFAWIDTYPSTDARGFDGAWSNYPYFPSGTVIISDIQSGLFVVKLETEGVVLVPETSPGPAWSPAGGDTLTFRIANAQAEVDPDSLELVVRNTQGSLTRVAGTIDGTLATILTPAIDCPDAVEWWIELRTTDGELFGFPTQMGQDPMAAVVTTRTAPVFYDDAESDPGWTTAGNATDGQWERGTPINAQRGDPPADADGSGQAWLTSNSSSNGGNSDVDGGSVTLTSPVFEPLTNGSLSFRYWLGDIEASPLGPGDGLAVQISLNDGMSWQTVRDYTQPTGQWAHDRLMRGVELPVGAAFRVRFVATDADIENVVEAGIDAVEFALLECDTSACTNPADANGDGLLTPSDFNAWILAFNNGNPACDQNGDGLCTPADFNAWIANYNAGCE